MKKQIHKLLAVVLSVIMIVSVFKLTSFSVFADTTGYKTEILTIKTSTMPNCLSIEYYIAFPALDGDSVGLQIVRNGVTVVHHISNLSNYLGTHTIDYDWTRLMGYGDGEFEFFICSWKNGTSCKRVSTGFKYFVNTNNFVKTSYSGKSGANLQWIIDTEGTLRIFGQGDMINYTDNGAISSAPWLEYYGLIKKIIVQEGVTSIGDYSFYCCFGWDVREIALPNSLKKIGEIAFYNCLKSGTIVIPENVTTIGRNAFKGCKGTIYAPHNISYDFSGDLSENLFLVYYTPVPDSGENVPQIVFESKKVRPGGMVDVNISLRNNPGIASLKLKVSFDSDLTLTNITYNDSIGGSSQLPQTMDSPVILNWYNGAANSNGDFIFATLTFNVNDNAQTGNKSVTVDYDPDDIYNIDENNIEFAVVGGNIEVISYIPGDINGDDKVNNKDLTRLFQYLSNWNVTVNEVALDVNGDGKVNNKDLTRLFQYLSNWDVHIF